MEKNCELNYSPKELSRNTVSRLFKELINNILTSCIYSCIWLKVGKCIWYCHLINWLLILLSENLRGWQPHFISTQERIGTNHISVINKLHRFNRYLDQSTQLYLCPKPAGAGGRCWCRGGPGRWSRWRARCRWPPASPPRPGWWCRWPIGARQRVTWPHPRLWLVQVVLQLRYGREDEELMGLQFCNEMVLASRWPVVIRASNELSRSLKLYNPNFMSIYHGLPSVYHSVLIV